jgi:hypothetical protein
MGFIKEERQTGEGEYAWVLVKTIDEKGEDYLKRQEESGGPYKNTISYGENNFSTTFIYTGPSDDYYNPPMVHGETITFEGSFSKPPEVIKAGEEISIKVELKAGGNDLSYFSPFAAVKGQMGKNDEAWWDFRNEDGQASFRTDVNNDYKSYNETITATAPSGGEGYTMDLRFRLYAGPKMETIYIYEWKKVND